MANKRVEHRTLFEMNLSSRQIFKGLISFNLIPSNPHTPTQALNRHTHTEQTKIQHSDCNALNTPPPLINDPQNNQEEKRYGKIY